MTELPIESAAITPVGKSAPTQQATAPGNSTCNDVVTQEFLTAEYGHVVDSFLRNEEDGEKRVTFFITFTSAVLGAIGFLVHRSDGGLDVGAIIRSRWFIAPTLLVPLAIGWLTVMRIKTRNVTADEYKLALRTLRRHFMTHRAALELDNAFFKPYESYEKRSFSLVPFAKAGWLEIVALVNALLAGMFAAVLLSPVIAGDSDTSRDWVLGAAGVLAALTWSGQILLAERAYQQKVEEAVRFDEMDRLRRMEAEP